MKGRVGPLMVNWAIAALFVCVQPRVSSGLFDSVWEADDSATELDSPQPSDLDTIDRRTEAVVSELWSIFFPESPPSAVLGRPRTVDAAPQLPDYKTEERPVKTRIEHLGITVSAAKRNLHTQRNHEQEQIPSRYVIIVDLHWPEESIKSEQNLNDLIQNLAELLGVGTSHIHYIKQTDASPDRQLSLYAVRSSAPAGSTDPRDLIPAAAAVATLGAAPPPPRPPPGPQRRRVTPHAELQAQVQSPGKVSVHTSRFFEEPYFAVTIASIVFVAMGILVVLVYCCLRKRAASSGKLSLTSAAKPITPGTKHFPTAESALLSAVVPTQICLYPAPKPSVNSATAIQPDVTELSGDLRRALTGRPGTPLSGSGSSSQSGTPCPGTPVHTPPLRIRARGLLERRGSNASLTLELGPGAQTDSPYMGSPPKESTVEEYLMSASHRMSRYELRRCLDDVKALYREFWEIPMNHPDKNILAGSGVKNRYRTIIPNETSRVKLPEVNDDPLTTYINANYIRGYGGEAKAFIATQGPMSNTICDFWKMIWQEDSPIIVMITKLKEKNKNKCENYVPEVEDTYGDINVKVVEIYEKEGYIIRKLQLQREGCECREVLHYWYTAWPDHKAPSTARQLLTLVRELDGLRRDAPVPRGPVTVHCSAGIGRTGCFIGASIGLQQLREEQAVDIQSIVCTMRLDRGGMVQTNEQYVFVHQTLNLFEQQLPNPASALTGSSGD